MQGEYKKSMRGRESKKQVMQESYSLEASLALLRTYVTQPDRTDIKLLADLLIKAMMQLPNSDFATILHLIPERLQVSLPLTP